MEKRNDCGPGPKISDANGVTTSYTHNNARHRPMSEVATGPSGTLAPTAKAGTRSSSSRDVLTECRRKPDPAYSGLIAIAARRQNAP